MGNYPVKAPEEDRDPRFTIGLVLDVAEVLESHGYPSLVAPENVQDFISLRQSLYRFIYTADGRREAEA